MTHRFNKTLILLLIFLFAATGVYGQSSKDKAKKSTGPKPPYAGEVAPLFTLKSFDGNNEWSLKEKIGQRPIIILFGSYT